MYYKSLEQKQKYLHKGLLFRLREIMQKYMKKELYSVLVSHIHMRESQINKPFHLSENGTIIFESREIPSNWSYVAYGHIHKPQALNNSYTRYAGSIERLNYGECADEKSVVLVDIGPQGRQEEPICLPLKSTPFYRVDIQDPVADMQGLRERYPDAEQALVSYRVIYKPGEHNLNSITQKLETVFPRCYQMQTVPEESIILSGDFEATVPSRDVAGTVESYINARLADHPDREDVLKLARELLVILDKGSEVGR
jgi:exonuclease SbcD